MDQLASGCPGWCTLVSIVDDLGGPMNRNDGAISRRRAILTMCSAAILTASAGCQLKTFHLHAKRTDSRANAKDELIADRFVCAVEPIIGTGWHGHTFPGATAPFGLVQLSPDTVGPPEAKWLNWYDQFGCDHSPGYHDPVNVI